MTLGEKSKKWILIVCVLAVVVVGGYFAIKALFPKDEAPIGPQYTTAAVTRGDIEVGVETTGTLNAGYGGSIEVPYNSDESGNAITYNIKEVMVKNGDRVSAGSPIMVLAAPSLDTQIKNLQEQLAAERKSLASMLGIPVDQVDYASADTGIVITSPIDGKLELSVKGGQKLEQGQLIGKVVNDANLELTASLTPYEFGLIKKGTTRAVVNTSSGMSATIDATIVDINENMVAVNSKDLPMEGYQPTKEETTSTDREFVYHITLQIKNPGLLEPEQKLTVGFYEPAANYTFKNGDLPAGTRWCRYLAPIDKYVDEEEIFGTVEGVVTKTIAKNNANIKKGDSIAIMAGQDVKDEIEKKLDSIRQKKVELSKYQAQQGSLTIVAPSDGIVDGFDKKKGGTVSSGSYLGHIFSSNNMNLYVQVDDSDVLLVQVGAPVKVTIDAMPDAPLEGSVDYIGGANEVGGITKYDVGISVTGNAEIRPGMQARAYIDSGSASDVLLVPMEAIFREDGIDKVEVLNDDGTVSVVAIEVGLMNSRQAEVRSGLEEGQLVITGSTSDIVPSETKPGEDILPGTDSEGEDDGSSGDSNEGSTGGGDMGGNSGDMGGNMGGGMESEVVPVGSLQQNFTYPPAYRTLLPDGIPC